MPNHQLDKSPKCQLCEEEGHTANQCQLLQREDQTVNVNSINNFPSYWPNPHFTQPYEHKRYEYKDRRNHPRFQWKQGTTSNTNPSTNKVTFVNTRPAYTNKDSFHEMSSFMHEQGKMNQMFHKSMEEMQKKFNILIAHNKLVESQVAHNKPHNFWGIKGSSQVNRRQIPRSARRLSCVAGRHTKGLRCLRRTNLPQTAAS